MIQGIKNANTKKIIFKHNDLRDLEEKLSKNSEFPHKIIVFESVYSMDGDFSPIKEICELAKNMELLLFR